MAKGNAQEKQQQQKSSDGICQRDMEDNWKSSQWPKLKQFEQWNKVILDYNQKNEINIYKSILK